MPTPAEQEEHEQEGVQVDKEKKKKETHKKKRTCAIHSLISCLNNLTNELKVLLFLMLWLLFITQNNIGFEKTEKKVGKKKKKLTFALFASVLAQ